VVMVAVAVARNLRRQLLFRRSIFKCYIVR
jgi:hypothetical protein